MNERDQRMDGCTYLINIKVSSKTNFESASPLHTGAVFLPRNTWVGIPHSLAGQLYGAPYESLDIVGLVY